MPATKAHLEANRAFQAKLDRIIIQPYKEEGKAIREAAAKNGISVQRYILEAVRRRMESEREQ